MNRLFTVIALGIAHSNAVANMSSTQTTATASESSVSNYRGPEISSLPTVEATPVVATPVVGTLIDESEDPEISLAATSDCYYNAATTLPAGSMFGSSTTGSNYSGNSNGLGSTNLLSSFIGGTTSNNLGSSFFCVPTNSNTSNG